MNDSKRLKDFEDILYEDVASPSGCRQKTLEYEMKEAAREWIQYFAEKEKDYVPYPEMIINWIEMFFNLKGKTIGLY